MAKSKEEVNKSQAIRDALRANRSKTPLEIAEMLTAKGIEVNAQYVKGRAKGQAGNSKGGAQKSTQWSQLLWQGTSGHQCRR
jgi:hypothetical protein